MKQYRVTVDGTAFIVTVAAEGEAAPQIAPAAAPAASPATASVAPIANPAPAAAAPAAPAAGSTVVNCPMPGTVLDIQVSPGDAVKKGQVLLVFEAMKMENEIVSPRDGVIASVLVQKGDAVNSGDALVSLN